MILEQYYLGCLSQASYLVGDERTGTAAVVDPRRDVDLYLSEADARGLAIRHVLLTHFHADFVSGHLELREKTGARIHLGEQARADYGFEAMADGSTLTFGDVRLTFLETPGHTLECVCILVDDLSSDSAGPCAVLTGDTLFIGDVGRPDLAATPDRGPEELAGLLFDSIRTKLMPLPDATLVLPGHGAGSACGKNMSKETVSTMGDQRTLNYALQPMSRDEFVSIVTAGQVPAPDYFAHDVAMNRSEHPTLSEAMRRALCGIGPDRFLASQKDGAQVLDTRCCDAFAKGHLADGVNIGLDGRYAEWAGRLLDRERPILLVSEPGREEESAVRLGRIGFDHVQGYLDGGPTSFDRCAERIRRFARTTPVELSTDLDSAKPPVVLDVREPGEREQGRIEGSLHIPLHDLPRRAGEVPRDRRVVLHCAGGFRSMIGLSLLAESGHRRARDLAGGYDAWRRFHGDA